MYSLLLSHVGACVCFFFLNFLSFFFWGGGEVRSGVILREAHNYSPPVVFFLLRDTFHTTTSKFLLNLTFPQRTISLFPAPSFLRVSHSAPFLSCFSRSRLLDLKKKKNLICTDFLLYITPASVSLCNFLVQVPGVFFFCLSLSFLSFFSPSLHQAVLHPLLKDG